MKNNFFSASLHSRKRKRSKTAHHIMEDNCALRFVLKYPGENSRAELVPSPRDYARNGASRRRFGDYLLDNSELKMHQIYDPGLKKN